MKVAYVFSTSGHTASYKLGKMILPQLEEGRHGAQVGVVVERALGQGEQVVRQLVVLPAAGGLG